MHTLTDFLPLFDTICLRNRLHMPMGGEGSIPMMFVCSGVE
jgi:hypothetical protein